MTEPKKYRSDWTIEPAFSGPGVQYYKHTPDMDNVHYCSTVEEAESEIDDAIIMEQEQVIERFRMALNDSTIYLIEANSLLASYGQPDNGIPEQVAENKALIKAHQS